MSMPLAPSIVTREVTGVALHADGTPVEGEVTFTSALTQAVPDDSVTILPGEIRAPIGPAGEWSIWLPVTDENDNAEPGFAAWVVRIPGAVDCRSIAVPSGAGPLRYVDAPTATIVPPDLVGVAFTGLEAAAVPLPAGALPTAEVTGVAPVPTLTVGIPKGDQGDRPVIELGDVATGAPGSDASATWSGVGTVANPYELDLTVPRGDVGAQGPQPQVAAGSVTKVAPGGTPTASITGAGTPANPYRVNLGVVTGDKGDKGDKGDPGTTDAAELTGVVPLTKGGTGVFAMSVAGLRAELGVLSDPAAATAGMRTLGAGAQQAAPGDHTGHAGDMPWTDLTLLNGWTQQPSPPRPIQVCRINGVIYIVGSVNSSSATSDHILTLPEWAWPGVDRRLTVPVLAADDLGAVIVWDNSGAITRRPQAGSRAWYDLSGIPPYPAHDAFD